MCTRAEAKQASKEAIEEYMTQENGDGLTVVEHEMQEAMKGALGSLTIKFGIALLTFAFVFGGIWFKTTFDIQANTDARVTGDRYTQEERDSDKILEKEKYNNLQKEIDQLRSDYKEDVKEIKDDLKFIREKLGG